MAATWQRFLQALTQQPDLWINICTEVQRKQLEVTSSLGAKNEEKEEIVSPSKGDRRFSDKQWRENPFFSMLMQNYLLNSEAVREVVEKVNLPESDKKLLRFSIGQYVDAMSPSNFPATNPTVMEEAMQTGGENFVTGMQNLMSDAQNGTISNTDRESFVIGGNIACTPGKVIAQNDVMQLIEYAPQTAQVYCRPLLIVPPCINKYYILDLQQKNSFVRHAIAAGHRVFLVSWVNAGQKQRNFDWDFYLREGVMAALDIVSAVCKGEKINTLGFCIGGTLLACALAVLAKSDESPAQSLTLLATMLDFSDAGEIGLFVDKEMVGDYEQRFADGGVLDGRNLARGFAALRPNDLIWPYFIDNYYLGKKPQAFDLLFWNADSTNLPGPMFSSYLRDTYLENRIAKDKATMCNVPVRLLTLSHLPLYAVSCEKDHIVPWRTAYESARLLGGKGSKARFVLAASGHIAGIINPPDKNKGWHQTSAAGVLPKNVAQWQATAKQQEGGWWNDWIGWLARQSGKKKAAPKRVGNVRYSPIEDAPGTYVSVPRPDIVTSQVEAKE